MTVLVVGATGMTGLPLVEQLLGRNHNVRAIVRAPEKFPSQILRHPRMEVIEASILDLTNEEMEKHVAGCHSIISCLGHVLSLKGMFGSPRNLCTEATRRLCIAVAINSPPGGAKFILMNTVGVANPGLVEKRTWLERGLLSLLRHTIPPHRDNETAAGFLTTTLGRSDKHTQWCIVRPDSLINADTSPYSVDESPTTGIFSGRPTTRANVAHFMVDLIEKEELWDMWKFRMPVIMNSDVEV